jgi:hypothetical protein
MSATSAELEGQAAQHVRHVTVTVFAPSHVKPKHFTWPVTLKVGVAAAEAAKEFKVDIESPTFQKGEKVLDREQTLEAAGVKEHDELELVSAGGGV